MAGENVEIVRAATDAFNRADVEAWLAHFDSDIVWYAFPEEPEPGPFRGHEAVRAMAARWMDLFSSFRTEVKEYIEAGEYVLVPARMLGRVPDSDADVVIDEVYVNKCRDGRIVEVRECRTLEEASEAAGLSVQDVLTDSP
jgi:ketosteroid isomerase-like protein